MRYKSSIMTTSWTTKADAEGRVTAAHKQTSGSNITKKQTKKAKKLRTSGFVLDYIQIQCMKKYSRTFGISKD